MEKSAIPDVINLPFSYVFPFVEAALSILLLIGFQAKYTIYSAIALMSILILGSSSVENWSAIEAQLLHSFYLFGLFWFYKKYSRESKIE